MIADRTAGAVCYNRLMAEARHDYMFLNGCDGSPLHTPENGLDWVDVEGSDLTEEEAKEQACDLSLRLGGFLVAAYRVEAVLCVQHFEGRFVDGTCVPIPEDQLPAAFRKRPREAR